MLIEGERPDLILLDWMLRGTAGIEICRQIKVSQKTRSIPVIMIFARTEEVDTLRRLETGADDDVTRPYSVVVLMAKAKTKLRRARPASLVGRLMFEDITLDAEAHKVFRADQELKLGPTEFRLLTTFMEKPRRVWSREHLLDQVWGRDIYVDTRTVDVQFGRLRKALSLHGGAAPIRTVRGAGYALG